MVTAMLTRPTSISPTSTCERKVVLVEKVDIGDLQPPRPRTIYLEPISKKTRRKKSTGPEKASATVATTTTTLAADADAASDLESMAEPSVIVEEPQDVSGNNPRSPIPSDIRSELSGDSGATSSTGLSLRGVEPAHAGGAGTSASAAPAASQSVKMSTVDEKTITATIELLKGGCLPGDTVSIKVSVQHIKRIKSMHGVIITLYRQGRIDSSPPSSAFSAMLSKEEARRLEKEEFYPKSKTGLGGLSLTSTTSLSVFRKDLSQAVAPLIIDPVTLDTTITATVKVPEDVFPTIRGVPGEMISFKYQLEVIVDLGGRLASQIQSSSAPPPARLGAVAVAGGGGVVGGHHHASAGGVDNTMFASWGGSVVDTDRLRREKGVISVVFEVVIGTADSSKQRGRAASRPLPPLPPPPHDEAIIGEDNMMASWTPNGRGPDDFGGGGDRGAMYYSPTGPLSRQTTFASQTDSLLGPHLPPPPPPPALAPQYVPPPELPDDGAVPEKERLRRAEARLLPSQPGEPAGSSSPWSHPPPHPPPGDEAAPMAPATVPLTPTSPPLSPPPNSSLHGFPLPAVVVAVRDDGADAGEGPSAPTLADLAPRGPLSDDKQEMERQRLLGEASAPPEFPDDYESVPPPIADGSAPGLHLGAGGGGGGAEPTAPVLTEDDEYGEQYAYASTSGTGSAAAAGASEPLPRYER